MSLPIDPHGAVIASSSTAEVAACPPRRLRIAVFLGATMTIGPLAASTGVLLPAKLQQVDPTSKIAVVATLAICIAVFSLVANLIFGALSDLTRTRLGRRTPWMIFGSVVGAVGLVGTGLMPTIPLIIVAWVVFQLGINALIAALIVVIPDRVPTEFQGRYSATYGLGLLIGSSLLYAVAGQLVTNVSVGFGIFAVLVGIVGPLMAVLAPDTSNVDAPRKEFTSRTLFEHFSFPVRDSRDFYLAAASKLLFIVAAYSLTGFMLFLLTDFIGVSTEDAGGLISITSLISLVLGLGVSVFAGWLSDKLGRRKAIVMISAVVIAVAILLLLMVQSVVGVLIYTVVSAIGVAAFNSVDQALNYEVLPLGGDNAAKNLGVLNIANTGGQILGPAAVGAALGLGFGYPGMLICLVIAVLFSALILIPIRKVR